MPQVKKFNYDADAQDLVTFIDRERERDTPREELAKMLNEIYQVERSWKNWCNYYSSSKLFLKTGTTYKKPSRVKPTTHTPTRELHPTPLATLNPNAFTIYLDKDIGDMLHKFIVRKRAELNELLPNGFKWGSKEAIAVLLKRALSEEDL